MLGKIYFLHGMVNKSGRELLGSYYSVERYDILLMSCVVSRIET